MAAIASWLQPAHTNNQSVDREVAWFGEVLAQTLGGWKRQGEIAESLGL